MYVYMSLGTSSPYLLFYEGAKRTPVTCVYCRSPWVSPEDKTGSVGSGSTMHGSYLNMSSAVGISGVRDTSSCESCDGSVIIMGGIQYLLDYHGPARYRQYRGHGCRNYY